MPGELKKKIKRILTENPDADFDDVSKILGLGGRGAEDTLTRQMAQRLFHKVRKDERAERRKEAVGIVGGMEKKLERETTPSAYCGEGDDVVAARNAVPLYLIDRGGVKRVEAVGGSRCSACNRKTDEEGICQNARCSLFLEENPSVAEILDAKEKLAEQGDWIPACQGTEVPFWTKTGRRLLYCYQPSTGKHAYLDVETDLILSDDDARFALEGR